MLSNLFNFIANMFYRAFIAVTAGIARIIQDEIIPMVKEFGSEFLHFLAIELGLVSYESLA